MASYAEALGLPGKPLRVLAYFRLSNSAVPRLPCPSRTSADRRCRLPRPPADLRSGALVWTSAAPTAAGLWVGAAAALGAAVVGVLGAPAFCATAAPAKINTPADISRATFLMNNSLYWTQR